MVAEATPPERDTEHADGFIAPSTALNFAQVLQMIEDGRLHQQLTDDLREMVATMSDHAAEHDGKAEGEIAITIKLKLEAQMFELKPEVKTKAPKPKHSKTVFWATPQNLLTRTNPRQMDMFGDRPVRRI